MKIYRKSLIIGIIILFIGAGVIPSIGKPVFLKEIINPISDGNFLYVGGSGEGNYTRIKEAIDDAVDGDTVFVFNDSSPYYEHVIIHKSINLIGENKNTTVIDGINIGDVVYVTGNWVNISGFTIQNSGNEWDAGIDIRSRYSTITGNIISNTEYGIYLFNSYGNTITDNIISDIEGEGIHLITSDNNTISGNIISNDIYGIGLYGSSYNTIKSNTITLNNDNGIFLLGSSRNIIKGNTISNNENGILLSSSRGYHYSYNIILNNNFIDNEQDAFFTNSFLNRWKQNYWNKPRLLPKLIRGEIISSRFPTFKISWFNIDWRPAIQPYNDISEAEHASVVASAQNNKIKITLTTGGQNYPSTGYSFANSVTIRSNGTTLAENNLAGNIGWEVGESLYIGGSTPTLDDEESAIGPLGLGTYDITVTIIETVVFDDTITII